MLFRALIVGVIAAVCASTGSAHTASVQPSANVVVIPGFLPPRYPGTVGVPAFPRGAPALSNFRFSQLSGLAITTAALQEYDSVILYGLRWATLSPAAQTAINRFALTGKVLIWDSDSTGNQNYASFLHPFTTTASGETNRVHNGSVVTFPPGPNPIASPDRASHAYLDPAALVASNHLVEDMSVMNPGAETWSPSLIAANQALPGGGWILAWTYGSTGDHTGISIYSGLDADAFTDQVSPNYAIKALTIQLEAPFRRSPDSACTPNCSPPPASTGTNANGTASGLGGTGSPTFAQCSFERRPPLGWVHGRITLSLKLSVASGIRGQVVSQSGKVLGAATASTLGRLRLPVNTRLLPSNRQHALTAVVFVNAAQACRLPTALKVDNQAPRLLSIRIRAKGGKWQLTVKPSEAVRLSILRHTRNLRTTSVRARTTAILTMADNPHGATLTLTDRSGNRTSRTLP